MRVERVPVKYFSFVPIAKLHESGVDHVQLPLGVHIQPTTLAGKLVEFITRKDEVKFLTSFESMSWVKVNNIRSIFETVSVRLHNSLISFVNDRTIRSDLVMFDYVSDCRRIGNTKCIQLESGWLIRTKKDDAYVELVTRMYRTEIRQPSMVRLNNWFTGKGTTASTVPAIAYALTLKIFNTEASFYAIDLYTFESYAIPCGSDEPITETNIDFYKPLQEKLTQKQKEKINERKSYFRFGGAA